MASSNEHTTTARSASFRRLPRQRWCFIPSTSGIPTMSAAIFPQRSHRISTDRQKVGLTRRGQIVCTTTIISPGRTARKPHKSVSGFVRLADRSVLAVFPTSPGLSRSMSTVAYTGALPANAAPTRMKPMITPAIVSTAPNPKLVILER